MRCKSVCGRAALMCVCLAWTLASCGSDDGQYDYVSASDAVVARGDLARIIENTGSEVKPDGVELSPSLQRLSVYMVSGRDRQHLDNLLAVKGVDLSDVVVSVDSHMEAAVTMRVTDDKKLKEYLQKATYGDMQESREKDYTLYRIDTQHTVYVKGSTACMLIADRNVDVSDIEARRQAAQSQPLQDWQKRALKEGNAFNMLMNLSEYTRLVEMNHGYGFSLGAMKVGYDEQQLEHAYAKVDCSLGGLELSGSVAMVDDDGRPIESKYSDLTLDTSLLRYASADDLLVAMTSVPGTVDWPRILNQLIVEMGGYRQYGLDKETVTTIGNVLGDIDGTVMLAAGPRSLLSINTADGWDAVLAAQMKPGMADKYMSQIKSLIEATNASYADLAGQYAALGYGGYKPRMIECAEADGGIRVTMPRMGTVYLKVIDNTLVASLAPVAERGDCAIAPDEFAGMSTGMILRVPRSNVFSSILHMPFGIDITYVSDSHAARFSVKETDAEGRMLENVFKLIAGQSR